MGLENIDFVYLLLVLGIGQCFFLITIILINRKNAELANYILAILLFAFLWYQLEFFLLRQRLDVQVPFIYSTRYGSWLIVGPLIYLYNKAILIKGYTITRKTIYHFLPFLVFTILLPLLFGDVITNRAKDYGMLTVFDSWNQEEITSRHYLYGAVFIIQYVHAGIYILFAYLDLRKIVSVTTNYSSSLPLSKIQSLKYLYLLALGIIVLCYGFVAYQFVTTIWQRNFDYLYVLPTLIFVFGLAYRAIKYPETVISFQDEIVANKYAKSSLSESLANDVVNRLKDEMDEYKLYRNSELRLNELAERLNVSNHHLSQVINEKLEKSFHKLVNEYRVAEAKEKIASQGNQTFLEIAYEVGFNSKNSFNNAFKKEAGMTPTDYKKRFEKNQ